MKSSLLSVAAGLLHWFTSPYVRRLLFDKKSGSLDVEYLSLLARPQHMRAHISELAYPDTLKPQVTFKVGAPLCADSESRLKSHVGQVAAVLFRSSIALRRLPLMMIAEADLGRNPALKQSSWKLRVSSVNAGAWQVLLCGP